MRLRKLRPRTNGIIFDHTCRRTTSSKWDDEFDPFQVFEVDHEACLDMEVEIKNGENITKGSAIKDFIDIPDPYVVLSVPGSSNPSQRTSALDNTVNPIWNQTFHFFLEPKETYVLHVTLMDANYILDETLGDDVLHMSSIPFDVSFEHTFRFPGGSTVDTRIKLQENKSPDLRFSLALCEEEKECLRKRRENVLSSLQKLLQDRAPNNIEEVPVVAILGSGGGFRAMTCFSGCVKALSRTGILDCATYISGLSGSSWLISTLYAHDKFPDISFEEVYQDLKESVTQDWKKFLRCGPSYLADIISKYRRGQPVSFTDFFGHLLGDVLLKGRKNKTLSDQQRIVAEGVVPFPLYTCLNAKAAVSCRSFSEWVEFSPYEIGIAKYGTFMKTEHFGGKFLCGKQIKAFPESPLHFLQGIWGSAFTILFKRLVLEGGSHKDLVQILRDINDERGLIEKVEAQVLEENSATPAEVESDSDDEKYIIGHDDVSPSTPCEATSPFCSGKGFGNTMSTPEFSNIIQEETKNSNPLTAPAEAASPSVLKGRINIFKWGKGSPQRKNSPGTPVIPEEGAFPVDDVKKKPFGLGRIRKVSNSDTPQSKGRSQSIPNLIFQKTTSRLRLKRQDAIKPATPPVTRFRRQPSAHWSHRRETLHAEREKKSTFLQSMMKNSNFLNSRVGRAGEILNPFRGLSLRESLPLSPFTSVYDEEEASLSTLDIGPGCRYDSLDNHAKKLFVVDSGLAFNSPFPLLLRPQRGVHVYLSFDFSQRPKDSFPPFKELLLAEKWAAQNTVPFPPIEVQAKIYSKDKEVKEVYVFKHPTDISCPVILHFPIVNNKFQFYKSPGNFRETISELEFGDFNLFDDPSQPYSSTNFVFSELQYDRLVNLSEFNTLLCLETIKNELAEAVQKRKQFSNKMLQLDATAMKVQKVLKASQMFRAGLRRHSLKINQGQGLKILNSIKARKKLLKNMEASQSSTSQDEIDQYQDAQESLSKNDKTTTNRQSNAPKFY